MIISSLECTHGAPGVHTSYGERGFYSGECMSVLRCRDRLEGGVDFICTWCFRYAHLLYVSLEFRWKCMSLHQDLYDMGAVVQLMDSECMWSAQLLYIIFQCYPQNAMIVLHVCTRRVHEVCFFGTNACHCIHNVHHVIIFLGNACHCIRSVHAGKVVCISCTQGA
jgi:hypothetical protein